MIKFVTGNIFESSADALVNTVNTIGVMGKGIALQFKKAFPNNFESYKHACKNGDIDIGKLHVFKESNVETGEKTIINFPTKKDWRKPSEYVYIEKGLDDLVNIIKQYGIKSIAIPPLGAGNGGLEWEKVKCIIDDKLQALPIDVYIYEPNYKIREKLKQERVKLTDARAMLLYVLFDLVGNGEFVSEFSSEKVCYFLQRFGGEKYFNLNYSPQFYGPYSGKVRYVLNVLNGSYLTGYSDMDAGPFEPLMLITDTFDDVNKYINSDAELKKITSDTINFLNGFYSDFTLELLSSIDYISENSKTLDPQAIHDELESWNNRKRSMFSNPKYIDIAINHIREAELK